MTGPSYDLPQLVTPPGAELGVLVWQYPEPMVALSSASVNGGLTEPRWVLNIRVPLAYSRTDLDAHVNEVAQALELAGDGIGLLTATDITRWHRAERDGVLVDATSGITKPTWAADPDGGWTPWQPGTINMVAHLPVPLEPSAAVNAVITMTEAKSQALFDLGVPGTGTASDAVVVVWPAVKPHSDIAPVTFCGPRSLVGSALAIAAYEAVLRTAGPDRVG